MGRVLSQYLAPAPGGRRPARLALAATLVVAAGAAQAANIELTTGAPYVIAVDDRQVQTLEVSLQAGHWLLEAREQFADVVIEAQDPISGEPVTLYGIDSGHARISWLFRANQTTSLRLTLRIEQRQARSPTVSIKLIELDDIAPGNRRFEALQSATVLSLLPPDSSDAAQRDALALARGLSDEWQSLGETGRAAQAALNAAMLAQRLDKLDDAIALATVADGLFKSTADASGRGFAQIVAGLSNAYLGNFDAATALLQSASTLLRPRYEGVAVNPAESNRCFVFMGMREYANAEHCYLELLPIATAAGDITSLSLIQNNLGGTFAERGQPLEAVHFLEQALNQPGNQSPNAARARLLNNIAAQYRLLGRVQDALNYYQEALQIYRDIGDVSQTARLLRNIGIAYDSLGVSHQAIVFLREAYALRAPVADAASVHAANQLAAAQLQAGDLPAARALLQEAIALSAAIDDVRGNLSARIHLGTAELLAGNRQAAVAVLREAISDLREQPDDRRLLGRAMHAYGLALGEEDGVGARRALKEGLAVRREIGDRMGAAETLTAIGWSHWAGGDAQAATQTAREAVQLIEAQRVDIASPDLRASYQAAVAGAYELIIYGLLRDGEAGAGARALEVAEQYRAQTLVDVLAKGDSAPVAAAPAALLAERSRIRAEINRRENKRLRGDEAESIAGLTAELDVLDDRIAALDPRYRAVKRDRALSADAMRALLGERELALQYFLGREKSVAWLISRETIRVVELPSAGHLNTLARNAHERLSRRDDVADVGAALGELLLAPFSEELAGAERIAIIADGALHYLPFDTLTTNAGDAPVLRESIVTYLPSLTTLSLVRATNRRPQDGIAVLADPVFSANDSRVGDAVRAATYATPVATPLNRLVLSGEEAKTIEALARERPVTLYVGFDANIASLRSADVSNAGLLHIAAHGYVDDEMPARTGLALSMLHADGSPRVGFVGLKDIYELRLNAELVVLSACDTALGANLAGEGLLGLTRGFMYAGASRVIASLWQVEDRATAELMRHLYAGMLTDGLSPAAALAAAKSRLRESRRWRHPYYWSGFVLVGDAG